MSSEDENEDNYENRDGEDMEEFEASSGEEEDTTQAKLPTHQCLPDVFEHFFPKDSA